MEVGCCNLVTPGVTDLGSQNPRWWFFTHALIALQCFQLSFCGWVFQSISKVFPGRVQCVWFRERFVLKQTMWDGVMWAMLPTEIQPKVELFPTGFQWKMYSWLLQDVLRTALSSHVSVSSKNTECSCLKHVCSCWPSSIVMDVWGFFQIVWSFLFFLGILIRLLGINKGPALVIECDPVACVRIERAGNVHAAMMWLML